MFRNYLLTAWKVYTRRKLFTAINLTCITLTLGVLLVVAALLQNAFFPSGVEGKSERFVQVGAMVGEPSVLLADEPTGNLDSQMGAEVMDQLVRLNQDGTTVVMVTHDEQEARRGSHILRVFDGQLVA